MKISILTLFPKMFAGPFNESIIKRAKEKGLIDINFINIRDFGIGNHKIVDDKPYGGGVGMVMKVNVLDNAIDKALDANLDKNQQKVILLDPRGDVFTQKRAKSFSQLKHLILLCGHYEGVDERVRSLVDETISIGDFILTGGEIPAMLIADSVARLVEGVLKTDATRNESFSNNPKPLLEYPQYTNPRDYKGMNVPKILLSGNHKEIERWKKEESLKITKNHRPNLV